MPLLGADITPDSDSVGAQDYGLEYEAFPLYAASGTQLLAAGGSVYGTAIQVRRPFTVTSLVASVTTAGGTLTANSSWGLLFNSAGKLVGKSADQSTAWATAGLQTMALTAVTSLTLPAGMYWGAVVSTGTTLPTFAKSGTPQALFNQGLGVALSRCGVLATSVTTAPTDITPASITQSTAQPIWFGLI
jgi:hypothetical protein